MPHRLPHRACIATPAYAFPAGRDRRCTMAPSNAATRPGQGTERVREHLMTSLHLGRLRPGDRVVSVRRLADITGLNRKTVHRAYLALVKEGVLDARPGAGTF